MSENHTPVARARELRKKMTPDEILLWKHLRNRQFYGFKFLRQHPIIYDNINGKPLFFIPDFYCAEKKLIIEIDGKIHDFQKEYDNNREEILINSGLTVLRFKNEEFKNIITVLNRLKYYLENSP